MLDGGCGRVSACALALIEKKSLYHATGGGTTAEFTYPKIFWPLLGVAQAHERCLG